MKIQFINHASFLIKRGNVSLLCDPWIEGTAFNNGWSLISRTLFEYSDFENVTHIWFSHEHPDHFSPPNLLKIPLTTRNQIVVLYHKSNDKRVINFCKKIGFKDVIELEKNVQFHIDEDFSILCNPYTDGDSYSLINVHGVKILNLNDCVVDSYEKASEIYKIIGKVDVLFTQFGYANKIGNSKDYEIRKASAREKLKRIKIQSSIFNPSTIVPFASFIYFSHPENYYMNDGIIKIDEIFNYITMKLKKDCLVMYPNDIWKFGTKFNSTNAIQKYLLDYNKIKIFKDSILIIDELTLIENSILFLQKIKDGYPKKKEFINSMNTFIYLSDYKKSFSFSGKNGLVAANIHKNLCDIELSSDSLNYCFKELWGGDTLNVNARFQVINNYDTFRNFGIISSCLNRQEEFPFKTLSFLQKIQLKIQKIIKL